MFLKKIMLSLIILGLYSLHNVYATNSVTQNYTNEQNSSQYQINQLTQTQQTLKAEQKINYTYLVEHTVNMPQNSNYIIYDGLAQQALFYQKSQESIDLNSYKPLMFAYFLFNEIQKKQLNLLDNIEISASLKQNLKNIPADIAKLPVQINQTNTIKNLLSAYLLGNYLDAKIVLIDTLIQKKIIENEADLLSKINGLAKNLGMHKTTYESLNEVNDLEKINNKIQQTKDYTTLEDQLRLIIALNKDFSVFIKQIYEQKDFLYAQTTYKNNQLFDSLYLLNLNIVGLHKQNAGKQTSSILISDYTEDNISKSPRKIYALYANTNSNTFRNNEENLEDNSLKLINYGLSQFQTIKVYDAKQIIEPMQIWMGKTSLLNVGVDKTIYLALPKGLNTSITSTIEKPRFIYAPIQEKEKIAYISFYYNKQMIKREPLIAMQTIEQGSWLKRTIDLIVAKFK